jgi:hypothetical protein
VLLRTQKMDGGQFSFPALRLSTQPNIVSDSTQISAHDPVDAAPAAVEALVGLPADSIAFKGNQQILIPALEDIKRPNELLDQGGHFPHYIWMPIGNQNWTLIEWREQAIC